MCDTEPVWAIVTVGGGLFLGRVLAEGKNDVLERMERKEVLKLNPAYELHVAVSALPNGTIAKNVIAMPFIHTYLGAPMYVVAAGVQFLCDMHENDRARYKKLAEQVDAMKQKVMASDAGIALARDMPRNKQ